MEVALQIHVELLPEGVFLATSEQLPGLVAQDRSVAEALEIARDVARRMIEARRERERCPILAGSSGKSGLHNRGGRLSGSALRFSLS